MEFYEVILVGLGSGIIAGLVVAGIAWLLYPSSPKFLIEAGATVDFYMASGAQWRGILKEPIYENSVWLHFRNAMRFPVRPGSENIQNEHYIPASEVRMLEIINR